MSSFIKQTYLDLKRDYGQNITFVSKASPTFDPDAGTITSTDTTQTSRELVLPVSAAYKLLRFGRPSYIQELSLVVVMLRGTLQFDRFSTVTVDSISYTIDSVDKYAEDLIVLYLKGTDNAS